MASDDEDGGGQLVAIRNKFLLPTAKLDDQKFEFYFLLDASGSMGSTYSGFRVCDLAKRALLLFLQSLPEDSYFNIVTFHNKFTNVFPKSVKYSQETLDQAKRAIEGFVFSGSDNIHSALDFVYRSPQIPGYMTQIFAITDGYVQSGREQGVTWQQVLEMISSKVKHARAFSLGIGGGVNREFVIRMASNSGGLHDFVDCSEQIESKILHMLKVSLQPALLKPIRVASASRLIPMYEP